MKPSLFAFALVLPILAFGSSNAFASDDISDDSEILTDSSGQTIIISDHCVAFRDAELIEAERETEDYIGDDHHESHDGRHGFYRTMFASQSIPRELEIEEESEDTDNIDVNHDGIRDRNVLTCKTPDGRLGFLAHARNQGAAGGAVRVYHEIIGG
ncbi:MAG: hypothetical protein D6732_17620 [Methanobacteriota archaeon]|nr:MAG: hypothetical protein D6732_17620 [Euryarchaeota archaeon]